MDTQANTLVIGVLGDFSGKTTSQPLENRTPRRIDRASFDAVLSEFAPSCRFGVVDEFGEPEPLVASLRFRSLADFSPARVVEQIPVLGNRIAARPPRDVCDRQIASILHHKDFQALESLWRSVAWLVERTAEVDGVSIHLIDVTHNEMTKDLTSGGDIRDSILIAKLLGTAEGQGYSFVVCDHIWTGHPEDIKTLSQLAGIATEAKTAILTGVDASLFGIETYRDLPKVKDLPGVFQSPRLVAWKSLRENPDSRSLVVTLPGILAREPHTSAAGTGYAFDEAPLDRYGDPQPLAHEDYLWTSSAYALADRIVAAFARDGVCVSFVTPLGGGVTEGLPRHEIVRPEGTEVLQPAVEVGMIRPVEDALSKLGFCPLGQLGEAAPVFWTANTLHKPPVFHDAVTTASAAAAARLPFVLATGPILRAIEDAAWELAQQTSSAAQLRASLEQWLARLVSEDMNLSPRDRATRPLLGAGVEVRPDPRSDGADVLVSLRPWLGEDSPEVGVKSPFFVAGRFSP
jgi:type VI secretion system protein ImpC